MAEVMSNQIQEVAGSLEGIDASARNEDKEGTTTVNMAALSPQTCPPAEDDNNSTNPTISLEELTKEHDKNQAISSDLVTSDLKQDPITYNTDQLLEEFPAVTHGLDAPVNDEKQSEVIDEGNPIEAPLPEGTSIEQIQAMADEVDGGNETKDEVKENGSKESEIKGNETILEDDTNNVDQSTSYNESEPVKDEDEAALAVPVSSPPRRSKGSSRVPTYSSIIRTRRKKTLQENDETGSNMDVGVVKAEPPEIVQESDKSDNECGDDKGKGKMGKGKGRTRQVQKPQPEVLPQSHLTRATAANMKAVQFLQLPWQQKKRRRGGKSEDESEEVVDVVKKTKVEEEGGDEMMEEDESGMEEEEEEEISSKKSGRGGSVRGRGRGRGRRGGGAKVDVQVDTVEVDENKKRKRKDSEGTDGEDNNHKDTPTKKRRGRPKKKNKEDTPTNSISSDTPSMTSPQTEENEETTTKSKEQIKNSEESFEEISSKVKETTSSAQDNDNKVTPPLPSNGDTPKRSQDDEDSNNQPAMTNSNKKTAKDEQVPPPPMVTTATTPIPSQTPPKSVPIEYPYPRYPMDDQGFSFPPIHPHSFPLGYPPFSASPYPPPTFMLPTSPHFPYVNPQDCLHSPHPPLYFPSGDPFSRYPSSTAPLPISQPTDNSEAQPVSSVEQPVMTTPATTATPLSIPSSVAHGGQNSTSSFYHVMAGMGMGGQPHPLNYPPTHNHHYTMPPYHAPIIPPNMSPLIGEWMPPPHQIPTLPTSTGPPIRPSVKPTKEPRFPLNLISSEETNPSIGNPVDCPECGRHFKNNKALNGHMRLHGGFDWTRRVCRPYVVTSSNKKDDNSSTNEPAAEQEQTKKPAETKQNTKSENKKEKEINGNNNSTRHIAATLDDLCRAAEELERIERDEMKTRPSPLVLHHERRLNTSFSPPYTPPPILSPARSLVLLSGGGASGGSVSTPSKIIWPQRKASDSKGTSAKDFDELMEPKINVGKEFQANIPACNRSGTSERSGTLVWKPMENLSQEDEDTIDGYLELACSPAVPFNGRNKELALHLLNQVNGSVKEAVRLLVHGKSLLTSDSELCNYNYIGTKYWSSKERQQFRRAWRIHRKCFNMIQSSIESKSLTDIIEYYYSWKKYYPDEYRGRNRHISDEILSEDDDLIDHPLSAGSNSSEGIEHDQHLDDSTHLNGSASISSGISIKSHTSDKSSHDKKTKLTNVNDITTTSSSSSDTRDNSFSNHSNLSFGHVPVQEYRCKYPGCNQVYTSIFALNGHIRIHGGSWYPKKPEIENMQQMMRDMSPSSSSNDNSMREDDKKEETRKQLEIAKTMVMDLPQPRSPAYALGPLTPSPKASPNRGKSSLVKSKKACSASPADREGYYPCNRCGRVFHKVKSRSAHMKSHIIKQIHQE